MPALSRVLPRPRPGNWTDRTHLLLLAGVPERFPNIRFGWIETGCQWIPRILDSCDMFFHGTVDHPSHRLTMTPTEQWKASCFAAGPLSKADVALRERIGVETIAFGSDFIHVEGTYPHSRTRLARALEGTTPAESLAISARNAARLFDFDLTTLATTPAAQHGPVATAVS
ncbi:MULTISPECIES: amidohydrolase family protein [unclassified Pseudofrankia]|uniref:amidohydrolase family protein n=1 Tax=unclassified Pseudofrankia TaxID=2994372 RepID=UPI0008DAB4B1|nr:MULTISPECIES: amidohydrolase family protein [unclassified Pseudofrankia]MDT3441906.1 amidohydrolase family protein [Pseudofrankia sp. BMG5.37]OHV44553.1 hypothetical protein BCD48_25155 [Pseudofrankia sp. BMG5.36]